MCRARVHLCSFDYRHCDVIIAAVMQWGPRPGFSCNSAWVGIGPHTGWGAGGHWSCDIPFNPGNWTELGTGTGVGAGARPRRGVWNYISYTYGGDSGPYALTERVYINGEISTTITGRLLSITRSSNLRIGQMLGGGDTAGAFALSRFRMHDGCLSPADVRANYEYEALLFVASPTVTPSPTSSITGSASDTVTATGTQIANTSNTPSGSRTASVSSSRTPSATSTPSVTPTSLYQAAGAVLVDLHAADYDDTVEPNR